jgi:hypothetical protein
MANEIRDLKNSVPLVKNDFKQDWKEDSKGGWKLDWASDLASVPANTVAPAITGTAQVGQTLTVSNGTWTGTGITYTYAWKAAGSNAVLGTASTYVLTANELGKTVTCRVTATNSAGKLGVTSAATAAVIA